MAIISESRLLYDSFFPSNYPNISNFHGFFTFKNIPYYWLLVLSTLNVIQATFLGFQSIWLVEQTSITNGKKHYPVTYYNVYDTHAALQTEIFQACLD